MAEEDKTEAVVKAVAQMKEAADANGGKIAELSKALADLKAAHDTQRQALAEAKASAVRRTADTEGLGQYLKSASTMDRNATTKDEIGVAPVKVAGDEAIVLRGYVDRDGRTHKGLLDDIESTNPWQLELQRQVSKRAIIRQQMRASGKAARTPTLDAQLESHIKAMPEIAEKIFADSAGIGAEWIFDTETAELARKLQTVGALHTIFQTVNIPAGGDFKWPFLNRGLTPYIKAAATVTDPAKFTASDVDTTNRTYSPKAVAIRFQLDEDAREDSLIAAFDVGEMELVRAIAAMKDDVWLNGHAAGTQDVLASWNPIDYWGTAGLGTAADHRRLADGLRRQAFARSTATDQNANQASSACLRNVRKSLRSAHAQSPVVIMSSGFFFGTALGWSDFLTWDKAGANATILNGTFGAAGPLPGQVGFLYGMPVLISDFLTSDLNASGVYDGVTTDNGSIIVVDASRYMNMTKGTGLRIEEAKDITRGVYDQVLTMRWLADTIDGATEKNVALGYNLDV